MPTTPAVARRESLARLIDSRGFVRVADAALELDVSTVTVRSDLSALEAVGRVIRVHGGAMASDAMAVREESIDANRSVASRAKAAIGAAAARTVRSGQVVFIDSGSTPDAVAFALVGRYELEEVTVVTNSLSVARTLEPAIPRLQVLVTGGTLRPLQHSLVNPFAARMLDALHLDLAVIGCTGVDADGGITNVNLAEAEVKRDVMRRTEHRMVVADSSKLGHVDHALVAPIGEVGTLVTAGPVDDVALVSIRDAGVDVVVAAGR